jgi:hypothetical protein
MGMIRVMQTLGPVGGVDEGVEMRQTSMQNEQPDTS